MHGFIYFFHLVPTFPHYIIGSSSCRSLVSCDMLPFPLQWRCEQDGPDSHLPLVPALWTGDSVLLWLLLPALLEQPLWRAAQICRQGVLFSKVASHTLCPAVVQPHPFPCRTGGRAHPFPLSTASGTSWYMTGSRPISTKTSRM